LVFLDKFTHFYRSYLLYCIKGELICVQILLNSTSWELETHAEAYIAMKKKLGLDEEVFLSRMRRDLNIRYAYNNTIIQCGSGSSILVQCGSCFETDSKSRVLMAENGKITAENKLIFF
jgi:hypothetical protein